MSTEPLIDVAGTKMTHAQFAALAKERGWGDPTGIDIKGIQKTKESEFEGGTAPSTYRVKEASGREHEVTRYGGQLVNSSSEFEDGTGPRTPEGWSVWAGNIPGKRNTRVLYGYDDAGNLTGVNLEQDSRWYEDAAPLIAMAAGPLAGAVAPGLAASIGSATGLGTLGSNMVAQGAISGGISALTGGDFLKGALTGAVGAAVIPEIAGIATGMGVDKALANTLAKGLVRGTSAALSGGSFAAGAASAGLEHIYGMVAAETGAPVDVVKAVGSAAGLPAAVNSAVSGGAKPASGASGASGTPSTSGLGSLTPAQAALLGAAAGQKAQQAKPQAAQPASGERSGIFTGNYFGTKPAGFAGGGMVKRFDSGGQIPGYADAENPFGEGDDEVVVIPPYEPPPAPSPGDDSDFDWLPPGVTVREVFGADDDFERDWARATAGSGGLMTGEKLAANPSLGQRVVNGLTAAGKALVTKPDGGLDFTKLAAMAGAAYSYNRNQQSAVDLSGVGTKAGIASLTSAREQVPYQSDANRTPGSGGRRYFTDVKYSDSTKADEVAAAQQSVETQARGLAALQSKSGGVYGTLTNPIAGSSGTAGSGNVMGSSQIPKIDVPATSNGGITSGSGYGPGGAPEQAPRVTSKPAGALGDPLGDPNSKWIEAIRADLARVGASGKQSDLDEYFRTTMYTPEQLAHASGYYEDDVRKAIAAAKGTQATSAGDIGDPSGKWIEAIRADMARVGASGRQEDLDEYFRTTQYTPEQLAKATGYYVNDVQKAMDAAKRAKPQGYAAQSYTQGAASSVAPTPTPGSGGRSGFVTGGGSSFTPEQSQAAIAANTAQIKQDLAGLNTDAALNAYLAKTNYTPEQLAIATGYNASDIATRMGDAWRGQSSQNTQQWLDSAYAPTSTQAPVPGTVIGGTQGAVDPYAKSEAAPSNLPLPDRTPNKWASPASPNPTALAAAMAPTAPAYAPQPEYYAPIQADIANLSSLGSQDALNSYLANTNYSADQLAAASGYNVADVQAAMDAAQQAVQSYWYSEGGQVRGYAEGGYLDGATNGQSDEIPATIEGEEQARLSHGEFVVPADVVSALGGGNSNAGAEVLYAMMDRIREQAFGSKQQMRPVDQNTLPA